MPSAKIRPFILFSALLTMAACTTAGPNALVTGSIDRGPNPFPRGTEAFCKRYAEQTFASTFDLQNSASSDAWAEQQAKVSANAAFERCREGKTN